MVSPLEAAVNGMAAFEIIASSHERLDWGRKAVVVLWWFSFLFCRIP